MGDFSMILFARPSIKEGAARLMDFGGTLNEYNHCATPEEADAFALTADWYAIGRDWYDTMSRHEPEVLRVAVEKQKAAQ